MITKIDLDDEVITDVDVYSDDGTSFDMVLKTKTVGLDVCEDVILSSLDKSELELIRDRLNEVLK